MLLTSFYFCCRCDIEQKLPRESNKVIIAYKFVIYKNKEAKEDDRLQEDTEPAINSTEDVNLESPSKPNTSIARQFVGKVADKFASGVKAVGKTIGNVLPTFSKTPHHIEVKRRTHSHTIVVLRKGVDKKGNPRQSLSTTYLIRHVDIEKCDSVSISVTPTNCRLSKAHLFVRFV